MPDVTTPRSECDIIVFDFDGTITTADTFALFLRYYAGTTRWAFNLVRLLPTFISYKLGLTDRHAVKKAVVRKFFAGEPVSSIEDRAKRFAEEVIPNLIRPLAARDIESKLDNPEIGAKRLYICSASIGPYLRHWGRSVGIHPAHIMATELESDSSGATATGHLEGYNVWGTNKVRRIFDQFAPQSVKITEAYGDTRGDREMLHAAQASFFKPFRV